MIWAVVITISMVANVSGSSIMLLLMIWGAYYLFELKGMTRKKAICEAVLIIVILAVGIYISKLPGITEMITAMMDSQNGKVSSRVTRGFIIFGSFR